MMLIAKAVLVAVMTVSLAGCVLRGKPKNLASTPPPPKTTITAPAPPEPLSIPQTDVDLPTPQTVQPDALNTVQPATPAPQVQAKPPATKTQPPRPTPTSAKPPETQPPQPPPTETPVEPPPVRIQEILPAEEQSKLKESAHFNQVEARKLLGATKPSTSNQRRAAAEIDQFLKQSEQAEGLGDMRLANQFAERAYILAKELQGGK